MKQDAAIARATERAKLKNSTRYVVCDPEFPELADDAYHVCDEFDLDTFYQGIDPVFCTDDVL